MVKLLVMDVDGTLTDGKIYMSNNGELMKAFNIKDGYALAHIREHNIVPIIITGRTSDIVKKRCLELGIEDLYQGITDKAQKLRDVCEQFGANLSEVAYIGDDVNDLSCMQLCGYTACPADAIKKVRDSVDYVCEEKGGDGAVREFIDYIISECLDK